MADAGAAGLAGLVGCRAGGDVHLRGRPAERFPVNRRDSRPAGEGRRADDRAGDGVGGDAKVEVSPGIYRDESCLLVRLHYPEGKPYWVRPQGLRTEGAEHRFYKSANKYTGLFWPVTPDQADVTLEGLGLVSLAEFKARCERRGCILEQQAPERPTLETRGRDWSPIRMRRGPRPGHAEREGRGFGFTRGAPVHSSASSAPLPRLLERGAELEPLPD